MTWTPNMPYMAESKKIVWEVAPYLKGRGLDVGAGEFKILPHATSVDDFSHSKFGFTNRPDILSDASDLSMFADKSMDFVYSSHTLEHVVDYRATLREWFRVLRPGGNLALYLPHKDFYPNIGQPGANPDHKHDFLPEDIITAMPDGFDLIDKQDRNDGDEYSMLLIFVKLSTKQRLFSHLKKKPEKTACVVRYGAFGDLMQASSVFAGLKRQGYHVTLFSSNPGAEVVKYDPNIDKIVLFDRDQVPNANLVNFWDWQKKKFTKWVNLSESVEGTLLAMPGRTLHYMSHAARHRVMNINYSEFQHIVAEVPHKLEVKFFPTQDEIRWAEGERRKIKSKKVVVWSLAGSSVHKTWAGLDNILASIMLNCPDTSVVLMGGPECVILEGGWENEFRVIKTCGKWSIRQSLTFAQRADLVIGPETGVLNAVASEHMPKIVLLSHSTVENLTRDWINTKSLFSKKTSCYPCHMLHFGFDHCKRHEESGTAQCQVDISIEEVWDVVESALL